MADHIRDYYLRERHRDEVLDHKFTFWYDPQERKQFIRRLHDDKVIRDKINSLPLQEGFHLLDFLCESQLWIKEGKSPDDLLTTTCLALNYYRNVRNEVAALIQKVSEDTGDALKKELLRLDDKIAKEEQRADRYTALSPSTIGRRGAATNFHSRWTGFLVRTLAEKFFLKSPPQYAVIARLVNACGVPCTRQAARGIFLKGQT